MYRNWFVSYVNQLTAPEASAFLSWLDTLDQPVSPELRACALTEISRNLDLNLLIYTLPWLARIALSDDPLQRSASEMIQRITADVKNPALCTLVSTLPGHTALISRMKGCIPTPGAVSLHAEDYINLTNQAGAILLLSLLPALPAQETADALDDDVFSAFLREALNGRYGRYALVLAADAYEALDVQIPQESRRALLTHPDRFSHPDLIYASLICCYEGKTVQEIKAELYHPRGWKLERMLLSGRNQNAAPASFWLLEGLDQQTTAQDSVQHHLWLWRHSACLLMLRRALRAGTLPQLTQELCALWQEQRDARQSNTLWINRGIPQYNRLRQPTGRSRARLNPFTEYPIMQNQINTLSACMAVPLTGMMIAHAGADMPAFLAELSLNHYDAFANSSIRACVDQGHINGLKPFSGAVIMLMAYARDLTSYIGKGYINESIPRWYYRLIEEKSLPILRRQPVELSAQERLLHSGASLLGCAFLCYEEASGDLPGLNRERLWLAGGQASLAGRLCRIILSDLWTFVRSGEVYTDARPEDIITTTVSLAYEHFPECISELQPEVEDWMQAHIAAINSLPQGGSPKTCKAHLSETAMLLRSYPAQEWASLPMELPPRDDPSYRYRIAGLSHKVRAILRDSIQLGDADQEVLEGWVDAIIHCFEPEKYARSLRFFSSEVLSELLSDDVFLMLFKLRRTRQGTVEPWTDKDTRDMAQVVAESIVDTSREAIFYQYAVGKAIAENRMHAHPATAQFIMQVYFSMILQQYVMRDTLVSRPLSPQRRLEIEHAAEGRELILLWFLGRIRGHLADNSDLRMALESILDRWRRRNSLLQQVTVIIEQRRLFLQLDQNAPLEIAGENHWNYAWDPDTLQAARTQERQRRFNTWAWMDGDDWKPVERTLVEFLVEQSAQLAGETQLRLVLIEADGGSMLVSTSPGCNYRLPLSCWDEASLPALDSIGSDCYGLYLDVQLVISGNLPRLHLTGVDTANADYAELFEPDEVIGPGSIITVASPGILPRYEIHRRGHVINVRGRDWADYMVLPGHGWSILNQRERAVWLQPDRDWRQLHCGPGSDEEALLRSLMTLQRGQIVELRNIITCNASSDKQQTLTAFTTAGIPVQAETDSVALDHYQPYPTSRSLAVISYVHSHDRRETTNGVVWGHKIGQSLQVRYLDENQAVQQLEVPPSALDVEESSIYVGLPVIVNAAAGSVQVAQFLGYAPQRRARRMNVRWLWPLKRLPGAAQVGTGLIYIGEHCLPGDSEPVYLVQNLNTQQLLAYEQPAAAASPFLCGVRLAQGKAVVKAQPNGSDFDVIEFRQGNHLYYGRAARDEFSRTAVRCAQVTVQLEEYKYGDTVYYDVQRVFAKPIWDKPILVAPAAQSPLPDQGQRRAQLYLDAYHEWRNNPDWLTDDRLHAEGVVINGNEGELSFQPTLPLRFLPRHADALSGDNPAEWTCMAPLLLSRPHTILPRSHQPVYAAMIQQEDGSLAACPDEAALFDLERFQRWLIRKHPGISSYSQHPLYYLEKQEDGLLFEWGLGFRVKVPESCLHVEGMDVPGFVGQLFFGDHIRQYQLLRISGRLCLALHVDDFELSLEHRICEDAQNRIVQYLKVTYDKPRNSISTSEVSVTFRELDSANSAWRFRQYAGGLLHDETEDFVRQMLPEGGQGYLLVQPDWDMHAMKYRFRHTTIAAIRAEDVLCLRGGDITPTASGNDYYVPFRIHFEDAPLLGENPEDFEIRVSRRRFSYNESVLRVYYTKGQTNVFRHDMLVKVEQGKQGHRGTLKRLPVRHAYNVREWLRRYGPQHVVIGQKNPRDNRLQVEIKPGVFCYAACVAPSVEGATGKLSLQDDLIVVEPLSEGDEQFRTPGRVVELLMMDGLFSAADKEDRAHFTVAGLPQIMLKNQELARKLNGFYPPRYGRLEEAGATPNVLPAAKIPFGYLKAEKDEVRNRSRIHLYPRRSADPVQYVMFHRMSFLDGGMLDLWNHIKRGQWHYHDRKTRVYSTEYEYGVSSDLPLIFHKDEPAPNAPYRPHHLQAETEEWTLRYPEEVIARYAFPPHELEEYGMPQDQCGLNNRYPVAAVTPDHLLIEMSPGRIVQLPTRLVRIAGAEDIAGQLCTRYIRTGDTVILTSRESEPGKPVEILLQGVLSSLRGMMHGNAYLPIRNVSFGKITLGAGLYSISYPSLANAWNIGQTAVLTQDNSLRQVAAFPAPGDLVMLTLDMNDRLMVSGFPQAEVSLSPTGTPGWMNDFFWLRQKLLQPASRKALFDMMHHAIPMRVEASDPQRQTLSLSYPQPAPPEKGSVFCSQVVGVINNYCLVLRAGSFLFHIDMDKLLGVHPDTAAEIVRAAQKQGALIPNREMWIRTQDRPQFQPGLYHNCTSRRTVRVLSAVDSARGSGFLCLDPVSQEWLWLPLSGVVRARAASAALTMEILRKYYGNPLQLTVSTTASGQLSWLKDNIALQLLFGKLSPGDTEHTVSVIVASPDLSDSEGGHLYLCHERPQGNIYDLRTELPKEPGEVVEAVCSARHGGNAELIPKQEIRKELHLSRHLLEALHRSSTRRGVNRKHLPLHYPSLENEIRCFNEGYADPESSAFSQLCALCGQAVQQGMSRMSCSDPQARQLDETFPGALQAFLQEKEKQDAGNELSLSEGLMLMLALWRISPDDGQKISEMLRQDAKQYACEAFLLEEWLLSSGFYGMNDLRKLLEMLDLRGLELKDSEANILRAGQLTPKQNEQLSRICETIRRRFRTNEEGICARLAQCLQYAVDQNETPELIQTLHLSRCWRLVKEDRGFIGSLLRPKDQRNWLADLIASPCAHITLRRSCDMLKLAQTTLTGNGGRRK